MSKLKLTSPFQMRFKFCILAFMISPLLCEAEDFEIPEVQTLDYEFMNKIAEFVKTTDHLKIYGDIYPETKAIINGNGYYYFKIVPLNDSHKKWQLNGDLRFYDNKSYRIKISYNEYHYKNEEASLFFLQDIPFCTHFNLIPYFQSCKVNRTRWTFEYSFFVSSGRFWEFIVNNGSVRKAYYYYEKDDLDVDNNLVYDLIDNCFVRFKDSLGLLRTTNGD